MNVIYSAKKVLQNRGLWQFISNTGNTQLHDLYQHLVPGTKITREMSEKHVSNGTTDLQSKMIDFQCCTWSVTLHRIIW